MIKIAYLTSWPPRPCGIANFAYDLAMAVDSRKPNFIWKVLAIDDPKGKYKYDPKRVMHTIKQNDFEDIMNAAEYINQSDIDLLVIQHEFNLFGTGRDGTILSFLKKLKKPSVFIMHSIPHPSDKKYINKRKKMDVIQKTSKYVSKIVVMCNAAKERLVDLYKINPNKIKVIVHGSWEFPKKDKEVIKEKIGFKDSFLLLNFGFIGKRKGLETIIKAMPNIVKKYPDVKLVLLGGVNPAFQSGFKEYLREIKLIIKNHHIEKNVIFKMGFIPQEEVIKYYQAADVFLYSNNFKSQISSGPLTYAIAAGKAIISTAFTYSEDILKNNHGVLVPIDDHKAMAEETIKMLKNPKFIDKMEENNFKLGKKYLWTSVADEYINLFQKDKK